MLTAPSSSSRVQVGEEGKGKEKATLSNCLFLNMMTQIIIWPLRIFPDKFKVLEPLGQGQFGDVQLAEDKKSQDQVAVKFLKCSTAREKLRIREELDILQSLKHPNIIQIMGAFEDSSQFVMIFECLRGGELFQRIIDCQDILSEVYIALHFVRQIVTAVAFLGAQRIVHLDIKPENIMCATKESDCLVKVSQPFIQLV